MDTEVKTPWTLAEVTLEKQLKILYSRLRDSRLSPIGVDKELERELLTILEHALDRAFDNGYDYAKAKFETSFDAVIEAAVKQKVCM